MKKLVLPLVVLVAALVAQAGASVVTSIPGGTVILMPPVNYFGPGPIAFGPGVTWSSTNDGSSGSRAAAFGFTGLYGFGANGDWTGALGPMAGLDNSTDFFGSTDIMTFSFASPVAAVGGFLNYYPGDSTPTTIAVWDSGGNLIESFDLIFLTSGAPDTGAFYGFQEATANISSFTLTDNYIGITNLTVGGTVPEPGSLLLIGTGLLGVIGCGRRRLGI